MASIRKMVLAGSRISRKTIDVLDGDRHDKVTHANNWSWYEVENAHMNPLTFGRHWGHPKHPHFAGEWKKSEGHFQFGGAQSEVEQIERRQLRGKHSPVTGMGKKAMEAKKGKMKKVKKK
eukprot:TRINITY_DN23284_c0_g1_i1.p1 TRINITY_DN23284_c0_g1~~TRINITY_DN23284_c0_g1_i1.p1  ORF type:complete len:120 (+),score=21.70 TRINITY_DN23284_c0_g1_i1:43-402(+)